jgi:fluoroquinolone resistance protein
MKQINYLRERWTEAVSRQVLISWIRKQQVESPFGTFDGRADFRGLVISEAIDYLKLNSADLSFGKFDWNGQFNYCRFTNCKFHGSHLRSRIGGKFENCDFSGAILKGATISGEFTNCRFNLADLRSTFGPQRLSQCTFEGADLRKAQWNACNFNYCVFDRARCLDAAFSHCEFRFESGMLPQELAGTLMEASTVVK